MPEHGVHGRARGGAELGAAGGQRRLVRGLGLGDAVALRVGEPDAAAVLDRRLAGVGRRVGVAGVRGLDGRSERGEEPGAGAPVRPRAATVPARARSAVTRAGTVEDHLTYVSPT